MKSFGPSAYRAASGEIVARCLGGGIYCFMHYGTRCGERDHPHEFSEADRATNHTPDWCKYRAGIIDDVKEAEDFARMGIDTTKLQDLRKLARALPEPFRPADIRGTGKYILQRAIRRARLAEEAAADEIPQ